MNNEYAILKINSCNLNGRNSCNLNGRVTLSDTSCKDDNARFTQLLLKLLSDQKCKDTVVFLTRKVFNSDNLSIASYKKKVTFAKILEMKIDSLKK